VNRWATRAKLPHLLSIFPAISWLNLPGSWTARNSNTGRRFNATHPNAGGTFTADGSFSLKIPASTAAGLYKGTVEYLAA